MTILRPLQRSLGALLLALGLTTIANAQTPNAMQRHQPLTQTWDKTFAKSNLVDHQKIVFHNRFGIELVADLYLPKNRVGRLPAVAVSGPFGAIKEQVSGRYAQHLAEAGFLAIAFDPSYTGESGGFPRDLASPDLNTEDFLAAVDYLSTSELVDPERIGILGICGWGGMALAAASLDPRIKATITSTMYDMHRVVANGYNDANDSAEQRDATRRAVVAQRTKDYQAGSYAHQGGVISPESLPADAPQFLQDYAQYYKVRAPHPRSVNSTQGFTVSSALSLLNFPLLTYVSEIKTPVLLLHGEKAHSRYMSETAREAMTGDNKELLIIPGANHCDLYDNEALIPWAKINSFFASHLK